MAIFHSGNQRRNESEEFFFIQSLFWNRNQGLLQSAMKGNLSATTNVRIGVGSFENMSQLSDIFNKCFSINFLSAALLDNSNQKKLKEKKCFNIFLIKIISLCPVF